MLFRKNSVIQEELNIVKTQSTKTGLRTAGSGILPKSAEALSNTQVTALLNACHEKEL